jgi:hypothetical protein
LSTKALFLIALSGFLIYAVYNINGVDMLSGFIFMFAIAPLMLLFGDSPAFRLIAEIIWWLILCGPAICGVWIIVRNGFAHPKPSKDI